MRIGITGGAGYIASHLVHELLKEDHELCVIDNLSTGSSKNIVRDSPKYKFIEGNISDEAVIDSFFSFEPQVIFHFAAFKAAGESMRKPAIYSENNVRASFKFLEHIQEGTFLIFSSSAAVYGNPEYLPMDEKHPLNPENYYGFTKKIFEENLEWYSRIQGIFYASLRYFNAAGYDMGGRVSGIERFPNNLLPIIMEVACGHRPEFEIFGTDYDTPDGTCVRDYIHVNDLVRAHLLAMDHIIQKKENLIVNLGSENGLSVSQILEAAREITGQKISAKRAGRRPGDPPILIASAEKARRVLGWKPEFSDCGSLVKSMWDAYRRDV